MYVMPGRPVRRRFSGAEVGGFNRLVCHLSAPMKISDLVSYALPHTPHLCRPPLAAC